MIPVESARISIMSTKERYDSACMLARLMHALISSRLTELIAFNLYDRHHRNWTVTFCCGNYKAHCDCVYVIEGEY